ncbi:MAG TPA: hypothetical protein PKV98_07820 [Burkholderiaceae bacterium]|nr:hypothetical protein [Burkholderiaceae bacterium]
MIQRIRSDIYRTSDGQEWTVWHEAQAHEKFLFLRAALARVRRPGITLDEVTRELLATEGLHVIVGLPTPKQGKLL